MVTEYALVPAKRFQKNRWFVLQNIKLLAIIKIMHEPPNASSYKCKLIIIRLAKSLYIAFLKRHNKRSTEKVNRSRLHEPAEYISGIFLLLLSYMSINV